MLDCSTSPTGHDQCSIRGEESDSVTRFEVIASPSPLLLMRNKFDGQSWRHNCLSLVGPA
ncbi:hypothetical protein Scep_004957 [Stephania cephalantha]|uniref:Uncharacterized protein n=1 Tax=Stephania cephalantha TaxID=152367 RepID=A0AAP0KTE5_9MAGN